MDNVIGTILRSTLLFLAAFGFVGCYHYTEKVEARDGTDAVSITVKSNPFKTTETITRRPYGGLDLCLKQERERQKSNRCKDDTAMQHCEWMGLRDQFLSGGGGMGMGLGGLAFGGGGTNAFGPPMGNMGGGGNMSGLAFGTNWSSNDNSCVTQEEADIRLGHLKQDLRKHGFEVDREGIRTEKYREDSGVKKDPTPETEKVSTKPKTGA